MQLCFFRKITEKITITTQVSQPFLFWKETSCIWLSMLMASGVKALLTVSFRTWEMLKRENYILVINCYYKAGDYFLWLIMTHKSKYMQHQILCNSHLKTKHYSELEFSNYLYRSDNNMSCYINYVLKNRSSTVVFSFVFGASHVVHAQDRQLLTYFKNVIDLLHIAFNA